MAKPIFVSESEELPGAYMCEHVPMINGSTKKGDDVLCLDCVDALDDGAELVRLKAGEAPPLPPQYRPASDAERERQKRMLVARPKAAKAEGR